MDDIDWGNNYQALDGLGGWRMAVVWRAATGGEGGDAGRWQGGKGSDVARRRGAKGGDLKGSDRGGKDNVDIIQVNFKYQTINIK